MTYVLLCADHDPPRIPDGDVRYLAGLCSEPSLLGLVPDEVDHLVLGVHWAEVDLARLQSAMRRNGFDPLSVGILDLTHLDTPDLLRAATAGMTARTEAFPGATPEQTKLEPAHRVSRRSLLSGLAPASIGAPAIDPARCVAADGCRACVLACPAGALIWQGGAITYDKTACITCGICITTCPTGAVVNPTVTPEAIERQIRAITHSSDTPIGIRFICRTGEEALPRPGYLDVSVACTGMLTPGWLLAPLLLGAAATDTAGCREAGCRLELDPRLGAAVDDASTILDALGIDPARLGGSPESALSPLQPSPVFGPDIDARVIELLAEAVEARSASAGSLRATRVGFVTIDPATCTACRMCARLCPTDALQAHDLIDGVSIDFDPRACVACGQCLSICPEIERGAISLEVGFDLTEWRKGRRDLRRDTSPRCTRCGRPIAPTAMLDRIAAMLGAEHQSTLTLLRTLCLDCRGR